MKILLIYPKRDPNSPVRTQFDWQRLFQLLGWPMPYRGYGLYLNVLDTLGSLAPPGTEVRAVNENIEPIDFDAEVDLVALSCMVTTASRGYEIADRFRRRGVQVVMGGYHPFIGEKFGWAEEILEHVDSVCTSEADHLWPQILEDARHKRLRPTYAQEHLTDMGGVAHRIRTSPRHWLRYGYLTVQASRGCPFHCSFCSIIMMLGNEMRYKPPEAVARELEPIFKHDVMGRLLRRPLFLVDDNVYGSPREFKKLLSAIIELRRKYPRFRAAFGSQLTINITRDREALELLREADFYNVFVGLESQDPVVLRAYGKHHNVAFDYDEAISTLRRYGMEMIASFIFGQDMETTEVFDSTYDFIERNAVVYPYFNILVPNDKQWLEYEEQGRILTRDWRLYDAQHTVFIPNKMRPIELQKGFADLVDRVFDYPAIHQRLVKAFVDGGSRQFMLPHPMQLLMFFKTLAALAVEGDREGYAFVRGLSSYILKNEISMFTVMFQLDQHDYAVKNRAAMRDHHFDLDVPSWQERLAAAGPAHQEAVGETMVP